MRLCRYFVGPTTGPSRMSCARECSWRAPETFRREEARPLAQARIRDIEFTSATCRARQLRDILRELSRPIHSAVLGVNTASGTALNRAARSGWR